MSELQVSQISGQGMNAERARVEAATLRLALINMAFSSKSEATSFAAQMGLAGEATQSDSAALQFKRIKEVDNPLSDVEGYVYKFDIDPTHEMATLVSATRAYEANVRAYNANSQLNKAALDIGSR